MREEISLSCIYFVKDFFLSISVSVVILLGTCTGYVHMKTTPDLM